MPVKELWKDLVGFENRYMGSTLGRIKSKDLKLKKRNGVIYTVKSNILNPIIDSRGYLAVCLRKNEKASTVRVHRVIALTFLENPENKSDVNHKNTNKLDNRAVNLEWATRLENNHHAQDSNLIPYKIQKNQIPVIKTLYSSGQTHKQIAQKYGVNQSTITRIINGKRRKRAHINVDNI